MGDGEAGQPVHPEAVPVKLAVGLAVVAGGRSRIAGEMQRGGFGGELTTAEGVIDAFTGKGLDHAGGIAGEETPGEGRRGEIGAIQRGEAMPELIGGQLEPAVGFLLGGGQLRGITDQTKIHAGGIDWSHAAIAVGQEFQGDGALIGRGQGRVALQGHTPGVPGPGIRFVEWAATAPR